MIHAQNTTDVLLLSPAAQTNSATRTANLDTRNADYVTIRMAFAAELNTNAVGPTISLLESDDTVVTNFATFNASFERSAEDLTSAKEVVYHIDTRSRKRYLRLSVTTATTTNDNVTMGAIATLSRKNVLPGSESDMVPSGSVCVIG